MKPTNQPTNQQTKQMTWINKIFLHLSYIFQYDK